MTLLWADFNLSTEGIVVITGLVAALAGAVTAIFRLYDKFRSQEHERLINELKGKNKSLDELTAETLRSNFDLANRLLAKEGKSPLVKLLAVVSEGHSPSTPEQREAARLATYRAQLAQVQMAMGQEPRKEPPRGGEDVDEEPPAAVVDSLKSRIAQIPDKTADKVIEKLKEEEGKP